MLINGYNMVRNYLKLNVNFPWSFKKEFEFSF